MKKVLLNFNGYIEQIVNPGEDFEIYNGPDAAIQWVDAPDNVQRHWTLEWSPAQQTMIWVERNAPWMNPLTLRRVAYGEIADQLDMMYWDKVNGTNSWQEHINNVKTNVPKPPTDYRALTPEEMMALDQFEEPAVERQVKLSTKELPAWARYSGWRGYQ